MGLGPVASVTSEKHLLSLNDCLEVMLQLVNTVDKHMHKGTLTTEVQRKRFFSHLEAEFTMMKPLSPTSPNNPITLPGTGGEANAVPFMKFHASLLGSWLEGRRAELLALMEKRGIETIIPALMLDFFAFYNEKAQTSIETGEDESVPTSVDDISLQDQCVVQEHAVSVDDAPSAGKPKRIKSGRFKALTKLLSRSSLKGKSSSVMVPVLPPPPTTNLASGASNTRHSNTTPRDSDATITRTRDQEPAALVRKEKCYSAAVEFGVNITRDGDTLLADSSDATARDGSSSSVVPLNVEIQKARADLSALRKKRLPSKYRKKSASKQPPQPQQDDNTEASESGLKVIQENKRLSNESVGRSDIESVIQKCVQPSSHQDRQHNGSRDDAKVQTNVLTDITNTELPHSKSPQNLPPSKGSTVPRSALTPTRKARRKVQFPDGRFAVVTGALRGGGNGDKKRSSSIYDSYESLRVPSQWSKQGMTQNPPAYTIPPTPMAPHMGQTYESYDRFART